ncbi:hypothetical protein [Oceanobacillus massiliensis]|uniref:ATP-grasp domain-containing protein n=1 Tax=Oceanobacillus massiliensis TaxID=1465765 RepID=UPI00301AB7E7
MKKGWLIYSIEDSFLNASYIAWFKEEAAKQFLELELVIREELTIGVKDNKKFANIHKEPSELPDFAVVRTIDPMLNLHLESMGIAVFNSSNIARICNDKALAHHHANLLQLPMVDTIYSKREHISDTPPLPYPFIVKEAGGRGGRRVFYIEDQISWLKCQTNLQTNIIIQSCEVQLGKDLRVFIVGKEVVAAVLRESSTDIRANYKLGGSASLYPLNPTETALVQKLVDHFEFGMVGIDFLVGLDGQLLFNEIEDVVGSRTLSATSDINILEKYIRLIKTRIT